MDNPVNGTAKVTITLDLLLCLRIYHGIHSMLGYFVLVFVVFTLCCPLTSFALVAPKEFQSTNFLDIDADSLSGLLSSPERYAQALNMTVDEVFKAKEFYKQASEILHQKLQSDQISGEEKHRLICENRLKYGRHPFCCNKCWSYNPVCICSLAPEIKFPLPSGLEQVIVWTHHKEWGLTSNTGSLLNLMLENTTLLMKGLPEHDKVLNDMLMDDNCIPVVLWPDNKMDDIEDASSVSNVESRTIFLETVREEIRTRKLILIAVDGTWRNARRMVARLPKRVRRLDLPMDIVFSSDLTDNTTSLLAPLRSKGPAVSEVSERQVCTAEAVTSALMQLGLSQSDGKALLDITRTKVDLIRRYRGMRL